MNINPCNLSESEDASMLALDQVSEIERFALQLMLIHVDLLRCDLLMLFKIAMVENSSINFHV